MKVVAYSIKPFEKEFLAKANKKKHEITLIANSLRLETIAYAKGKDAVLVFVNDDVSAPVINKLADMGIKYIATRSAGTDHLDKEAAARRGISLANVLFYSSQAIAEHAVAMALSLNRQIIKAHENGQRFDFKVNELIGFNFYGKTVGLIGLGQVGRAVAAIYNGFGCRVIGYDIAMPDDLINIESLPFNEVLRQSDILSLHLPLTPATKYMINAASIAILKNGVMLINTSRGGLLNTADALEAVEKGKIGYLGLDVYEHERGLFFEDHQQDLIKDPLLQKLMAHTNVMVTPHQAFLTNEALRQIAEETIKNLDTWQNEQINFHQNLLNLIK
jgi:D-lactate dehydrogenase